jgi:hypothetical protein
MKARSHISALVRHMHVSLTSSPFREVCDAVKSFNRRFTLMYLTAQLGDGTVPPQLEGPSAPPTNHRDKNSTELIRRAAVSRYCVPAERGDYYVYFHPNENFWSSSGL